MAAALSRTTFAHIGEIDDVANETKIGRHGNSERFSVLTMRREMRRGVYAHAIL
jgi:hypothetical protein